MTNRVVNARDILLPRPELPPNHVYVGRGGGRTGFARSEYANPYRIGGLAYGNMLDRDAAVALFRRRALGKLTADPTWLDPLIDKALVCHCFPKRCHAEVLVELSDRRKAEMNETRTL